MCLLNVPLQIYSSLTVMTISSGKFLFFYYISDSGFVHMRSGPNIGQGGLACMMITFLCAQVDFLSEQKYFMHRYNTDNTDI